MSKRFVVLRLAVLQEDEGRDHLLDSFDTLKEAETFINRYIADGYFKRSDMKILEMSERT